MVQLINPSATIALLLLLASTHADPCHATRKLSSLYEPPPTVLTYHRGPLLEGDIPISILWYGKFAAAKKAIILDFVFSLTPHHHETSTTTTTTTTIPTPMARPPSVSQWWSTVDHYLRRAGRRSRAQVLLANQVSDEHCSAGKLLRKGDIAHLAARAGAKPGGLALVLTAEDVAVDGFCVSNCGFHSSRVEPRAAASRSAFVWVGNAAEQCPGLCAWPFHRPAYGPQEPAPLVPPNGDVGVDGMVINLAVLLAGAVTNPYGDGFYEGTRDAAVEVAAVCPGVYGRNAYPGYPGDLLVDGVTGGSYNARGLSGREYLLPTMFDPYTSKCSPLV